MFLGVRWYADVSLFPWRRGTHGALFFRNSIGTCGIALASEARGTFLAYFVPDPEHWNRAAPIAAQTQRTFLNSLRHFWLMLGTPHNCALQGNTHTRFNRAAITVHY